MWSEIATMKPPYCSPWPVIRAVCVLLILAALCFFAFGCSTMRHAAIRIYAPDVLQAIMSAAI